MLAKAAGVSLRSVQRILEAHQLAPHRVRTFKLSNDPKFAELSKSAFDNEQFRRSPSPLSASATA
jgi:hypothetical protein